MKPVSCFHIDQQNDIMIYVISREWREKKLSGAVKCVLVLTQPLMKDISYNLFITEEMQTHTLIEKWS